MTEKEQTAEFEKKIIETVNYFAREFNLSNAIVVGVLNIVKNKILIQIEQEQ